MFAKKEILQKNIHASPWPLKHSKKLLKAFNTPDINEQRKLFTKLRVRVCYM